MKLGDTIVLDNKIKEETNQNAHGFVNFSTEKFKGKITSEYFKLSLKKEK